MLKVGVAREVRQLSETRVSGGGGNYYGNAAPISSSTTHFNRVRVEWTDGPPSFYDFKPMVSVGDQVAVASDGGVVKGEYNVNTGQRWYARSSGGCLRIAAVILSCFLVVVYGLGLLLLAALYFHIRRKNEAIQQFADAEFVRIPKA